MLLVRRRRGRYLRPRAHRADRCACVCVRPDAACRRVRTIRGGARVPIHLPPGRHLKRRHHDAVLRSDGRRSCLVLDPEVQGTCDYFDAVWRSLPSIMIELGHDHTVKLDVGGAEYAILATVVDARVDVRVVCVEFHVASSIQEIAQTSWLSVSHRCMSRDLRRRSCTRRDPDSAGQLDTGSGAERDAVAREFGQPGAVLGVLH
jgi:hypothetical protein